MATECYSQLGFGFQPKLVVDFAGGTLTTDAGLLLVREFDEQLGLSADVVGRLSDTRDARYITHDLDALVRQRLYQIAAGTRTSTTPTGFAMIRRFRWWRVTDGRPSDRSRRSRGWRMPSTGRRFSVSRGPVSTGSVPMPTAPTSIPRISSSISTARTIRPTGRSSSRCFMAGTTSTCITRSCGSKLAPASLLRTRLRPGRDASATGVVDELRHLLPPLPRRFPHTPIFLRGDAGMATPAVEAKLEAEGIHYVLGIGTNRVFKARVAPAGREGAGPL